MATSEMNEEKGNVVEKVESSFIEGVNESNLCNFLRKVWHRALFLRLRRKLAVWVESFF